MIECYKIILLRTILGFLKECRSEPALLRSILGVVITSFQRIRCILIIVLCYGSENDDVSIKSLALVLRGKHFIK